MAKQVNSLLSRLWSVMVSDRGLSTTAVSALVNYHVDRDTTSLNTKKRTTASIFKNIVDKDKSIKNFIYLLTNVMRVRKFTLTLTATYPDGTTATHSVSANYSIDKEDKDGTKQDKTSE